MRFDQIFDDDEILRKYYECIDSTEILKNYYLNKEFQNMTKGEKIINFMQFYNFTTMRNRGSRMSCSFKLEERVLAAAYRFDNTLSESHLDFIIAVLGVSGEKVMFEEAVKKYMVSEEEIEKLSEIINQTIPRITGSWRRSKPLPDYLD